MESNDTKRGLGLPVRPPVNHQALGVRVYELLKLRADASCIVFHEVRINDSRDDSFAPDVTVFRRIARKAVMCVEVDTYGWRAAWTRARKLFERHPELAEVLYLRYAPSGAYGYRVLEAHLYGHEGRKDGLYSEALGIDLREVIPPDDAETDLAGIL